MLSCAPSVFNLYDTITASADIFHLAGAAGINFSLIFILWLIYCFIKNAGVIDVYWPIGIFVCGLVFYILGGCFWNFTQLITLTLLIIWAARLGLFLLFTRVLKGEEDARYQEISKGWKKFARLKFLANFLFQGTLQWVIALVFFNLFRVSENEWLVILELFQLFKLSSGNWLYIFFVGAGLTLIGIIGETIADIQLRKYLNNNHDKNQVFRGGIWRYSRHPNYFFEFLVWAGFAIQSFSQSPTIWALSAPITLWIIFYLITIPITERHMLQSRGKAFEEYQRQTSKFIPLPLKNRG